MCFIRITLAETGTVGCGRNNNNSNKPSMIQFRYIYHLPLLDISTVYSLQVNGFSAVAGYGTRLPNDSYAVYHCGPVFIRPSDSSSASIILRSLKHSQTVEIIRSVLWLSSHTIVCLGLTLQRHISALYSPLMKMTL